MQPKRKQIVGRGKPDRSIAAELGEKYLDEITGRRWIMTDHGWELAVNLGLDVLTGDKGRWISAAAQERMRLEDWIPKVLNEAAGRIK